MLGRKLSCESSIFMAVWLPPRPDQVALQRMLPLLVGMKKNPMIINPIQLWTAAAFSLRSHLGALSCSVINSRSKLATWEWLIQANAGCIIMIVDDSEYFGMVDTNDDNNCYMKLVDIIGIYDCWYRYRHNLGWYGHYGMITMMVAIEFIS